MLSRSHHGTDKHLFWTKLPSPSITWSIFPSYFRCLSRLEGFHLGLTFGEPQLCVAWVLSPISCTFFSFSFNFPFVFLVNSCLTLWPSLSVKPPLITQANSYPFVMMATFYMLHTRHPAEHSTPLSLTLAHKSGRTCDVGFLSVCYEYVLLPLVIKEVKSDRISKVDAVKETPCNCQRRKTPELRILTSKLQPHSHTQMNRNGLIWDIRVSQKYA